MNNKEYWENRAAWNMYHYMDEAEKKADLIAKVYRRASMWLSFEAEGVFEKYMTKHKLSENEAKQLLNSLYNKTSVEELLRKLKEGSGELSKAELLKELEAPAYQARLERLRQLQNQLDLVMRNVYQQEKDFNTAFYTDLGNEAYYHSIFEVQKQTGFAFSFNHISSKQIDRALSINWSGQHYSKRIWSNTQALAKDIKEELLVSLITGRTERETAEIISNKFGQGAMQARRIVRTESCFQAAELTAMAYEECEIERYMYLATLDLRTSEICRSLDGKLFLVSERKSGKNYPPMHPWCRSTTIADITEEVLQNLKRRAYNPKTGRTELVPVSMNYEQWYKKFVDGNPEAKAQEKAIKNHAADRKQYERYKEVLGKDAPDSFVKFQEMKYNEPEKWDSLHVRYSDARLKVRIRSDSVNKQLEEGKQGKHILGHNNYIQGRSYLTISMKEAQELINKYAGTGEIKRDHNGHWLNKEFVKADKQIGIVSEPQTGEEFTTSRFSIHYSKNGTHIVPRKEL